MKKIISIIFAACTLAFVSAPALALNLDQAKSQGLVGEQANGYLGAVKPSGEVNDLVNNINSKRKQAYQGIASKNGTSLQAVEKLGGQKAIEKTPKGQFINTGGGWKKK